ncbi:MAG: hypothetical protein ABIR32_08890 [Ilumatobacteraceae bacterium]
MNPARYQPWLDQLTDEQRAEVFEVVNLPDWMVESLEAADIAVVSVELPDGPAHLMTTAFRDFLDGIRETPQPPAV